MINSLKSNMSRVAQANLAALAVASSLFLVACQPKQDKAAEGASQPEQQAAPEVGILRVQSVPVTLPKEQVCLEDGCIRYNFQTLKTNQPWVDEYFLTRIKRMDPNAFANLEDKPVQLAEDMPHNSESTIYVRYLGQNYNLASFELFSYTFPAGAAHGLYHKEYVILDLAQKKRVAVADLIKAGSENTLRDRLYQYNQSWLNEHNITQDKFELSDNFYYGNEGIVFVYSLYELASYAEGLSELSLPYDQARDLINEQYLPSEPVVLRDN